MGLHIKGFLSHPYPCFSSLSGLQYIDGIPRWCRTVGSARTSKLDLPQPENLLGCTVVSNFDSFFVVVCVSVYYRNLSTAALMERIPSRWPRPEWHAPWKNYRVRSEAQHCCCITLILAFFCWSPEGSLRSFEEFIDFRLIILFTGHSGALGLGQICCI